MSDRGSRGRILPRSGAGSLGPRTRVCAGHYVEAPSSPLAYARMSQVARHEGVAASMRAADPTGGARARSGRRQDASCRPWMREAPQSGSLRSAPGSLLLGRRAVRPTGAPGRGHNTPGPGHSGARSTGSIGRLVAPDTNCCETSPPAVSRSSSGSSGRRSPC
mgnify:CR=1 FL=1|jgi:hypothetical protein